MVTVVRSLSLVAAALLMALVCTSCKSPVKTAARTAGHVTVEGAKAGARATVEGAKIAGGAVTGVAGAVVGGGDDKPDRKDGKRD